jgi:hypothetical protein
MEEMTIPNAIKILLTRYNHGTADALVSSITGIIDSCACH